MTQPGRIRVDMVYAHNPIADGGRPRYADLVQFADPQIVKFIRRLQDEVREERQRDRRFEAAPIRDRSQSGRPRQLESSAWEDWGRETGTLPSTRRFC